MVVKTHTFKLGKYYIDQSDPIEGVCDTPNNYERLHMIILNGNDIRTLSSTIHESMHAEGIPDRYLHGDKDSSENIARFLWRLGWRRTKEEK